MNIKQLHSLLAALSVVVVLEMGSSNLQCAVPNPKALVVEQVGSCEDLDNDVATEAADLADIEELLGDAELNEDVIKNTIEKIEVLGKEEALELKEKIKQLEETLHVFEKDKTSSVMRKEIADKLIDLVKYLASIGVIWAVVPPLGLNLEMIFVSLTKIAASVQGTAVALLVLYILKMCNQGFGSSQDIRDSEDNKSPRRSPEPTRPLLLTW